MEQRVPLRVGIVGHRRFASNATAEFVAGSCAALLRSCLRRGARPTAISALAEGADSTFARQALELGLPLTAVRPFEHYLDDFEAPHARRIYERLRAAARDELTLPFVHRSTAAYVAAMNWVVHESDLLVAVWDGRVPGAPGGTASAVARATRQGRAWIHVDVTQHRMAFHVGRELAEQLPYPIGARP